MKYKLIPLIILFLTTIALSEDMTPQETANGCCGTMVVLPALYKALSGVFSYLEFTG